MKKYESPKIEFQLIRLNEQIAKTCWGHHGTDTLLWYDSPGSGYISFKIADGSCAFNPIEITYKGFPEDTDFAAVESEFRKTVKASGGDQGNPFKGEGTVVIPGPTPPPSFS